MRHLFFSGGSITATAFPVLSGPIAGSPLCFIRYPSRMKLPGRNAPCPCGSGKKYKVCCLALGRQARAAATPAGPVALPLPKGKFSFEPGSYGGPGRGYMPAVSCLKLTAGDTWDYHYILVSPEAGHFRTEAEALTTATRHLAEAFQDQPEPLELAARLRSAGYMKATDARIVPEGL